MEAQSLVPRNARSLFLQFVDACYKESFDREAYSALTRLLPHQGFAYGSADLRTGKVLRFINKSISRQYYSRLTETSDGMECPIVKKWTETREPTYLEQTTASSAGAHTATVHAPLHKIAVHGVCSGIRNEASWFVFTGFNACWHQHTQSVLRMVAPHLHAALYPNLLNSAENRGHWIRLSDREQDVCHWLAHGRSAAQVANILGISTNTVRVHIRRILQKLNASNIPHAITISIRAGIVKVHSEDRRMRPNSDRRGVC